MGELIPIYLEEIVPGDHFMVSTEIMARLAPTIAPIMHRVNLYVHYFFVPNRITWNQWEDFITGGQDGLSVPSLPTLNWNNGDTNEREGSLGDYLGLPVHSTLSSADNNVSQLPFRAYQQIFNDYYIDPNVGTEVDITDAAEIKALQQRAWEKDYFTSALPWAQRGDASATGVPVDIIYKDKSNVMINTTDPPGVAGHNPLLLNNSHVGSQPITGSMEVETGPSTGVYVTARIENDIAQLTIE